MKKRLEYRNGRSQFGVLSKILFGRTERNYEKLSHNGRPTLSKNEPGRIGCANHLAGLYQ